ncbi:MAG: hypothetical protein E2O40_04875 [Planctomycetota bacterium]|nr:MAG: hypothetical protein E2O40_04875 [Planctomycetota bacterium]
MPPYKSLIAMLGALAIANTASATLINLSDASSDETDAGLLSATMDFEVLGNVLTLTVTNNTADPTAYKINELYFNVPDGVTLSFDGLAGWSDATNVMVGLFGTFDFALLDGQGGSPNQILAGETVEFTFTITIGTPEENAFVTLFSDPVGDGSGWIVAAKFVSGPGDDNAYGAAIPTPGVLALLGAAGLIGSRRRRRRA